MSKIPEQSSQADELLPEYQLDYRRAKPNRFAPQTGEKIAILLDADVAQVFQTAESVNRVLRALIEAMPSSAHKSAHESAD